MKITTNDVARALGISTQAVRIFLQQGRFPFGAAAKAEGSSQWMYVIYPKKFHEFCEDFDGDFGGLNDGKRIAS